MPWPTQFRIDHQKLTVHIEEPSAGQDPSASVIAAFKAAIDVAIAKDVFRCLGGRHSEPYSIPGAPYPVHFERFAASLFGITTRGAHLTAYTFVDEKLMIWVPRRSQKVGTWKGMLDSTVAGGVAANETPFENIVREAAEEASLSDELVRSHAKQVGVLTYMGLSQGENGWEKGMALPDMVCVYDLELPSHVIPRPCDEEVKEFQLMDIAELKQRMLAKEFKPNSAVIMLDFLIRHGLVTIETEKDYVELVQRMHRQLPFPV